MNLVPASMAPLIPSTPPHVSLNRVRIVDLPGVALDDEVRGETAYHLMSAMAVARYAHMAAAGLRLPAALMEDTPEARRTLPNFVDGCLAGADPAQRAAAEGIGRRMGRNLGHILLALHRGDHVNRAARAEWEPDDWARWGRMQEVWLGGGLLSGRLGAAIADNARVFLAEASSPDRPRVALSPWGRDLPLLGAARYLPPEAGHALCLDFGQTSVKRACVTVTGDAIREVFKLTPLDTSGDWLSAPHHDRRATGRAVLAFIAETVAAAADAVRAAGMAPGPEIMLALASYVDGGRLLSSGGYATMMALADDVRPLLAEAIAARTGRPARLHLIHDGTAAAACHAGKANTAVIVAGTALGVGFPPASAVGLRSLP